jgi:hypothetical protein
MGQSAVLAETTWLFMSAMPSIVAKAMSHSETSRNVADSRDASANKTIPAETPTIPVTLAMADLLAASYRSAKSLGVSTLMIRSAMAEGCAGRSFSRSPLTGGIINLSLRQAR